MVQPGIIEARLGELGFRTSRWFSAEIHELQHILMDNEKIVALACGRYFGSFALLVATDQRLLLIDKRMFFMNLEDTRYDMISEIDFNSQVYMATVTIHTMNKMHKFTSMRYKAQLRDLTNYVQKRVMEFRNQQGPDILQAQLPAPAMASTQPDPRPQIYHIPQPSEPRQMSAQPRDYYVDDSSISDNKRQVRERVGHVAHVVGSAATHAAHHTHTSIRRPVNPYLQGSLMSRRPISQNFNH